MSQVGKRSAYVAQQAIGIADSGLGLRRKIAKSRLVASQRSDV